MLVSDRSWDNLSLSLTAELQYLFLFFPKEFQGSTPSKWRCPGLAGLRERESTSYLRVCCIQESSTGGGAGMNVVAVLMSPMITRASLRAWYM